MLTLFTQHRDFGPCTASASTDRLKPHRVGNHRIGAVALMLCSALYLARGESLWKYIY